MLPVGGDLASWVPVEIGTGWISFAGDQRYLYSVRWRSALFGPSEVEIGVARDTEHHRIGLARDGR